MIEQFKGSVKATLAFFLAYARCTAIVITFKNMPRLRLKRWNARGNCSDGSRHRSELGGTCTERSSPGADPGHVVIPHGSVQSIVFPYATRERLNKFS